MLSAPELFQQGIALQEKGLFDRAIDAYSKALELDPDNIEVKINLGAAFLQKGLSERSTEILGEVLQKEPDNALALFNIGKAYLYKEDAKTALAVFERTLEIQPNDLDVQKSIAQCLSMLDQGKDAAELLFPRLADLEGDADAL